MDFRRRRGCPSVNVDSLISTINFVEIAIVNTVRSDGTMFTSRENYPENAMLTPLRSIYGIMEAFVTEVERWGSRIKLLARYEAEISELPIIIFSLKSINAHCRLNSLLTSLTEYIFKGDNDRKKFRKIRHYLREVGEIDDSYCATFGPLIEDLKSVAMALEKLSVFLDAICTRPFEPPIKHIKHAGASSSVATVIDDDSPSPIRGRFSSICIDSPITTPSPKRPSWVIASDPAPSRPRSNSLLSSSSVETLHATASWKSMLASRYPVESLSVSRAELDVFSTVLSSICMAKEAVEDAKTLCQGLEVLSNDMQQVYEGWEEIYLEWKQSQKANNESGGSQGYAEQS